MLAPDFAASVSSLAVDRETFPRPDRRVAPEGSTDQNTSRQCTAAAAVRNGGGGGGGAPVLSSPPRPAPEPDDDDDDDDDHLRFALSRPVVER